MYSIYGVLLSKGSFGQRFRAFHRAGEFDGAFLIGRIVNGVHDVENMIGNGTIRTRRAAFANAPAPYRRRRCHDCRRRRVV